MKTRCSGKGYEACRTCINREFDPFECEDCDDGSNWEGEDDSEELSIHDLKTIRFKEAA